MNAGLSGAGVNTNGLSNSEKNVLKRLGLAVPSGAVFFLQFPSRSAFNFFEMKAVECSPEILPLTRIRSTARFVIYSASAGLISEHERASDAAVAFYQFAAKELQGTIIALPGIYKRTSEGWAKV